MKNDTKPTPYIVKNVMFF